MRLMISIFLLTAGCVTQSACVSSRPVHYYALQTAPPPANQSKPDGLVLLVGNVSTPEVLQDSRIRYRSGSNEAGAYEYHRWTERPGSMVRDALIRALREAGKYQRVMESGSSVNGDCLVRSHRCVSYVVVTASTQTQ